MKFYIFNNAIPHTKGMSGSDRRALEYSKYFLKSGHEVTVIVPKVASNRYSEIGVKLIISDPDPSAAKPSFGLFLKRIRQAKKACKGLKLEDDCVIYSSSDLIADSLPALDLKRRNMAAKLVCGLHLISPHPLKGFRKAFTKGLSFPGARDLYYYLTQKFIIARLKKYADLVLVSNEIDRLKLLNSGFDKGRVLVAYGASDSALIEKIKAEAKIYDAVFIGRSHEQKGLSDLIKAVKIISGKKKDFLLALISDISRGELSGLLNKYGIAENIVYFGFKDHSEKFIIIKESKLLIFPSFYESFGMVICEALSCAVPVVTYDLPIYSGIYPQGMIKVPIGDVNALAEKVLGLLSDSQKLNKLSTDALEVSKRFSWKNSAQSILNKLDN